MIIYCDHWTFDPSQNFCHFHQPILISPDLQHKNLDRSTSTPTGRITGWDGTGVSPREGRELEEKDGRGRNSGLSGDTRVAEYNFARGINLWTSGLAWDKWYKWPICVKSMTLVAGSSTAASTASTAVSASSPYGSESSGSQNADVFRGRNCPPEWTTAMSSTGTPRRSDS